MKNSLTEHLRCLGCVLSAFQAANAMSLRAPAGRGAANALQFFPFFPISPRIVLALGQEIGIHCAVAPNRLKWPSYATEEDKASYVQSEI